MKNIVVRNNTFQGTDTGLRFKSAVKRGGTSENIYIDHIYMTDIKDAAITFETTYFDNHVGAKKQTAPVKQEFLPNFQDIHMSDIYVRGCKTGVEAHGAEGMVHDITIKTPISSTPRKPRISMQHARFRWKTYVSKVSQSKFSVQ